MNFPQRFGDVEFVLPEFRTINEAAYWDYQRSKVYVRSNSRLRRQKRKDASRQSVRNVPVSKLVVMNEERPGSVPTLRFPSDLQHRNNKPDGL